MDHGSVPGWAGRMMEEGERDRNCDQGGGRQGERGSPATVERGTRGGDPGKDTGAQRGRWLDYRQGA